MRTNGFIGGTMVGLAALEDTREGLSRGLRDGRGVAIFRREINFATRFSSLMRAFMWPRDVGLFLHSARTDARLQRLHRSLGSMSAALETVYADDADPWSSASTRYRYQAHKYDVLASLLPRGRFRRALDLGCGHGLFTRRLSNHADEVVGIDISPSAIERARALHADRPSTTFETVDLQQLPHSFDDSFDLVTVADVLYYLSPLDEATLDGMALRIAALLRPGGTCLISNHYFFRLDRDSRRTSTIHAAFKRSSAFLTRDEVWHPFYLTTVLHRTQQSLRD